MRCFVRTRARARAWGSVRRAFPSPSLSSPLLSSPLFTSLLDVSYLCVSNFSSTAHHPPPLSTSSLSLFLPSLLPLLFHLSFLFFAILLAFAVAPSFVETCNKRVHVRFRFLAYFGMYEINLCVATSAYSLNETQW